MKIGNLLCLLVLAISFIGSFANLDEGVDASNEAHNKTKNITKRLLRIHSIEIDFISQDIETKEKKKFHLLPLSENNTGVVYLDLKTRGFKFTFNKENSGVEIQTEENLQPQSYFEKVINEQIGTFNLTANKLSNLRLLQPKEKQAPFEFSQLLNQCWRIDIYPELSSGATEFSLNLKFCVKKYDDHLMIRKYGYLLEAKELDHTNKE